MNHYFLINDFYTVGSLTENNNNIEAEIILNPEHAIFKGHFEQMPLVPGVCQTQIIKELLQQTTQKNLRLTAGNNIKFMGMIVPKDTPKIHAEINYRFIDNNCVVEAKLFNENSTFTKFKGEFSII